MEPLQYHRSTAAGLRLARRQLEALPDNVFATLMPLREANRIGSSSHHKTVHRLCREGFIAAGHTLSRTIIDMKGPRAANRRGELSRALEELRLEVLVVFDDNDGSPRYRSPVVERAALAEVLLRDADDILLDFDDGIIPMKSSNTVTDNSVHVTAGDSSNIAVAGSGSEMRDVHLSMSGGISAASLRDALEDLNVAILTSGLDQGEKDRGADALTLALLELDRKRDPATLKRHLSAAADFAGRVGASAAGGVIGQYAAGLLGL